MEIFANPFLGSSDGLSGLDDIPYPSRDFAAAIALIRRCPVASATPLAESKRLAEQCGVARMMIKDERNRMGMGSFKALGAAYAIAAEAQKGAISDRVFVTASAGNHGLSVAAGARVFGAKAVIYLSETVPDAFAGQLEMQEAKVVRAGKNYEESMAAAAQAADENGWTLLSDSSWHNYLDWPNRVMEGYGVLMHEVGEQLAEPPTHIFLQAGVGGLAASCAGYAREKWGSAPIISVVEPEEAPALIESIRAGTPVTTSGGVSCMGRLDCKTPSLIALKGLARDADMFVTITEQEAGDGAEACETAGLETSPSGAAGIAALIAANHEEALRDKLRLDQNSVVLTIVSEGRP